MYERPKRPPGRHHDEPAPDVEALRALLVDAIDNDPDVRAALLRLLADRPAAPKPRRTTTRVLRGR
jgi:hypothetical protein